MTAPALSSIKQILRLLAVALVILVGLGSSGWWSAKRVMETFGWVDHTHQVLYELESTLMHAVSIQSGARGFALTGQDRFLAPYESGLVKIQLSVAKLKELTADNVRQRGRVDHLASLINEEVAVMQQRLTARRQGGLTAASAATADGSGKRVLDSIRTLVAAMETEERGLLKERSQAAQFYGAVALALLVADAALVGALIALALARTRRLPRVLSLSVPA
ncbi:MAG: CHASE3 domain-containing protein [Verrucomicrobia bacterium]|nr:CHASE3 domain-containing protein [Verrucomicrobiota bacterium]